VSYSGKFDAEVSSDVAGLHSGGHGHAETIHATHAPSDAIVVPDAHLLFLGDYKRSGVDLIISKDDRELVLHDYFKGEKRAALSSPDGAHLTGDLVNALSGHVQYAQADGSAGAGKVIGHVTKLVGTVTAMRNGVVIILNAGDNVEKGDVVQSGSNSKLIISFIDGTVFALSADARMVLNEMVYDSNGSDNSSLLSLVAGTISFVAGETAKHGDMKVATPVATMGIRGTAILTHIDIHIPLPALDPGAPPLDLALLAPSGNFLVLVEPDGHRGSAWMYEPSTLTPLAELTDQQINISQGTVTYSNEPLPPDWQNQVDELFRSKYSANPKSLFTQNDTITPQGLTFFHLASGDTATPLVFFATTPASNSSPPSGNGPPFVPILHIDQPPSVAVSGNAALTVHTGTALNTGFDSVSGTIRFADINAGDDPTASTNFVSLKLVDAHQNDITATLTSQQIAAIAAQLVVTPNPGNNNNGSATWTYSAADTAFNFLTAGETLTLTYNAVVNNNYLPLDQVASVPLTITINGTSGEEWIHPTAGLWSVGSNWSSGNVPTATDDAIIPAQNIPGGTGLYDVTIETPAVARTLTLNANDTTGGQVTNDSTLTIGETLTIFNDGVLNNLATVSVGTQIELLNQSSLQNSGLITLGQGGDFKDSSTVTNSGTMEIAGGTLNVEVDIANSGGIINVDDGATLSLSGMTINGGTVNDGTASGTGDPVFGSIYVMGPSTISNASLNNGGVTVASGVTLTLDNDTVNGTTFNDTASGAIIQIDDGTVLTLTGGATLNGGIINDGTADGTGDPVFGSIDVTGPSTISNVLLNNGGVTVASGVTLTLDNDTVNRTTFTDASGATIQIDDGTVLTLTGGATLNGGTINDGTASGTGIPAVFGSIDVTGPSAISNVFLNNGGVTIASGAVLTLSNDIVTGTTFTDGTNSPVEGGDRLALNGSAVSGTLVGTIDISGAVTIQDGVVVNSGAMSIARGATLDIENPVTGSGATFNAVDVMNSGTIQVDSPGAGTTIISLVLEGGTTVTGGTLLIHVGFPIGGVEGTVEVGTGGATFNSVTVENNNILKIDDGITLSVNGSTFDGGILGGFGTIATVGAADTLSNVTIDSVTTINVTDNTTLELKDTISNAGTIALNSSGDATQLEISGSVMLDGSGFVNLTDDTHNAIVSDGSAATFANSDAIAGAGTIGDTLLALVNDGTIDATGTNPLTIDTGVNTPTSAGPEGSDWFVGSLTVTNNSGGVLEASAGHTLQIDDNVLNNGLIESGDTGGAATAVVNVAGSISGTGSIEIFDNAKVEIGGSVSSGQTVTFEVSNGGGELILDDPNGFQGLVKGLVEASSEAEENYLDLKGFSYTDQTKVVSAEFNSTTDITAVTITNGNSANNLTIDLFGDYHQRDIEFASDGAGGTLLSDPAANSAAVSIDSSTTLDIAAASTATVSFANGNGNTGKLVLDNSQAFTGQIVGFAGEGAISNSDLIDLADVNIANVAIAKTVYTDNANDTGTLTLYNVDGHALDSITFDGSYQLANFTIENDGSGHTLIVDPPVSSGTVTNGNGVATANTQSSSTVVNNPGPAANSVVMHDPGPAPSSTFAVTAPNQKLSGFDANDAFVFNFAGVAHAAVAEFHPLSDVHQLDHSIFGNAQAVLNAMHDDGHGNTVMGVDGHVSDVLMALLHIADFHVV